MTFDYEIHTLEEIRKHIQECEGRHVQQAVFSTFMNSLTQICFTCQKVRGMIEWNGNRSWLSQDKSND